MTVTVVIILLRNPFSIRPMNRDLLDNVVIEAPSASRWPRQAQRIAIVTETYPPEVNGVAMSLARLVSGLRARGHDIQLIRPRQSAADSAGSTGRFRELLTDGCPIPGYPGLRMGFPSTSALLQRWSQQRPNVVHIATEGPLGWSALRAAGRLKLPVTSDFRTNFQAYVEHYRIGWLARPMLAYLRRFHNRTDCTMVPTAAIRGQLSAQRFERISVVGRGIDTGLFRPSHRSQSLRHQWGAAPTTPVLICVGRLAPEKNLLTAIKTYDAVRNSSPDAKLVLVGDGPMRAELQARCPHAIFAGQRHDDDLAAHYASADIFLFPSLTETYGNVVAEAMASGLPVIAFDQAAAGQLITPGFNGVLIDGDGSEAFVQAALSLVSDTPQRTAMGEAARQSVLNLGWDDVVHSFESVLLDAIARRGTHPG